MQARSEGKYGFVADVERYPHAFKPEANRSAIIEAADSLSRSMYVQIQNGGRVSFSVSLPAELRGISTALRAMCMDGMDVYMSMSVAYVVKRGD